MKRGEDLVKQKATHVERDKQESVKESRGNGEIMKSTSERTTGIRLEMKPSSSCSYELPSLMWF